MKRADRISCCLVSPDLHRIEAMRTILSERPELWVDLVYATCDCKTLLLNVHRYSPDCCVIDTALNGDDVRWVVACMQQAGFHEFLFLGPDKPDEELPGEIIPHSAPLESLLAAVARTARKGVVREPAATRQTGHSRRPVMITVHSPKGGTGKTLLASSIALQYARKRVKTLLLDLSVYGGVGPALGLPKQERGLDRVLQAISGGANEGDPIRVREHIAANLCRLPAGNSVLDLLLPAPPIKMASLDLETTELILRWIMSSGYEAIVVDTSSEIAERTTVALQMSDFIALVMTPDFPSAFALVQMRDLLRNIGGTSKVHIVVNRAGRNVPAKDLEEIVGYPVTVEIPELSGPWEQATVRDLRLSYTRQGMALKSLAQKFAAVYSSLELPGASRWGGRAWALNKG